VTTTDPEAPRGLLIAAEGLDGSGKSAGLGALARWLERKGRRTHEVTWPTSRLVARAAAAPRGRQVLTVRVAALLAAAEAAERIADDVTPRLARGDVVLADRYAWTGVAREVARGLDPAWAAALYAFAPAPDLVLFHRQGSAVAMARALATRPAPVAAESVAAAYGAFLERLMAAFEGLADGSMAGPWAVRALTLDLATSADTRIAATRDAVRPLLEIPSAAAAARP
jgi:thymidylate kinase